MGKNCNLKESFQHCIYCNSRDDLECARNTSLGVSTVCNDYLGTCVTGIDAHGTTHRRCGKDYAHETIEFPNDQFKVCRLNNCNNIIFPPNRLHCYQCNGEKECDFMPTETTTGLSTSLMLQPCATFSELDQCFAYLSEGKL